jgi:hypothetical protein
MSMGDAMTAMPDHLADEVAQPETVTSRTERGFTPNTECFTRVIMPLRAIIGALPSSLADSSDGDTWLCLESVMSGLYGALIALEDIDRKDQRDRRARHPLHAWELCAKTLVEMEGRRRTLAGPKLT